MTNNPLTHLILAALANEKPKPKPPRLPVKPPKGGIVGPLPPELEGQVAPLWPGLYPPGTVSNFRPLLRMGR